MNTERIGCSEAREKLPLYVGADLDRDVLEGVRAHLEVCGECARREAQAARARNALVSALRSSERDAASPGLWPALRTALRAEGLIHEAGRPPAPVALPRTRRARWAWALAPVAAAAAVLAIVELSGLSTGASVPRETPHGDVVVERSAPAQVRPAGLERVPPEVASPVLVPYPLAEDRGERARVRRLPGATPGAPVYSVGLPFR